MTSTTDFPDWIPGQVSVAQSRRIFNSGITHCPVDSAAIDVSPYNSIVIQTNSLDTSAQHPILVQVIWSSAGNASGLQTFVVGNGYPFGAQTASTYISLPCLGDAVTVVWTTDNITQAIVTQIFGSARLVPGPNVSTQNWQTPSIPGYGAAVSIPAGGFINSYCGPFTRGVNVSLASASNLVILRVFAYFFDGTWKTSLIAQPLVAASAGTAQEIEIPNRYLFAQVSNTAGVAEVATWAVTEVV